jgi:hypothetical protein
MSQQHPHHVDTHHKADAPQHDLPPHHGPHGLHHHHHHNPAPYPLCGNALVSDNVTTKITQTRPSSGTRRLYLARHGETALNALNIPQGGGVDCPLNERVCALVT